MKTLTNTNKKEITKAIKNQYPGHKITIYSIESTNSTGFDWYAQFLADNGNEAAGCKAAGTLSGAPKLTWSK